jgi:hypothetical protein
LDAETVERGCAGVLPGAALASLEHFTESVCDQELTLTGTPCMHDVGASCGEPVNSMPSPT